MKNTAKYIKFVALITVIGVSVVSLTGCAGGNSGSGGLTITNMDAYIGCYIYLDTPVPPTYAVEKVTFTLNQSSGDYIVNITPAKITSGTAKLNVLKSKTKSTAETYTGSSTEKYIVWLYDLKQGGNPTGAISGNFDVKGVGMTSLAFTDGKATLNGADINWDFINP